MRVNKDRRGVLFIMAGLLAIFAALFLTVHNYYQDYISGINAEEILYQLDNTNDIEIDSDSGMTEEVVDDHGYIGKLLIPVINIELPIIGEWSYESLKIAPCRYTGSVDNNDLIIAGHNYSTHFGRLKELDIGDEVIFTDINGNSYMYEVVEKEILKTSDVDEMESGDWDLTLFTCTVGGTSRVTIRCELIK